MSTTLSVNATVAVAWNHPRFGRIREVVCGQHESELLAALRVLGIGATGEPSLRSCLRCAHAGSRPADWLGSVATPIGEEGESVHDLLRDVRRLTEQRDEARRQRDALQPGEGRVVVELPAASDSGRDKSWATFGAVTAWLGTTEVQYRGELMGPGSARLRAAELLAAAELASGTAGQGAAS